MVNAETATRVHAAAVLVECLEIADSVGLTGEMANIRTVVSRCATDSISTIIERVKRLGQHTVLPVVSKKLRILVNELEPHAADVWVIKIKTTSGHPGNTAGQIANYLYGVDDGQLSGEIVSVERQAPEVS